MGELVAVRCAPGRMAAALRGVWDAGDALLPVPYDAPDTAVDALLRRERPAALLDLRPDRPGRRQSLADAAPVDDDVALVVPTSGSTGEPKGVELTHAAVRASTRAGVERLGCRAGERWALVLPTHHVAGLQVLLRSWELGTDAEGLDELVQLGDCEAVHVSLVPTQLVRLLEADVDLSRFATVLLGGGRVDAGLLERARRAGAPIVTSYGMTETCGGCVYDGRPLRGVDMRVRAGRVELRGPVLFRGYRGMPPGEGAAPDAAGWFTTGDRGRIVDGRLEVLGRADDVIVSGGENVPVDVVEASLRRARGVAEVAVVPRTDDEWGEVAVAVVVATDPADPPTLTGLRAHVSAGHPSAFAPRDLVVVTSLPRDAMGKPDRRELQRTVAG